ncbi:u3 small nucleolar RNA-associated protein 4 homolog [Trichonephila inaurata madagascariensis]|uniref:U3 small nucleolar RNA-associated protein 4 homolog n=1 Tax=Trichonephila inaurata madagascariensis TaxID=2747483 RepID=A0A8X6Y7B4_9ARAC|nr:u3 small nucleolar RNA-associated protein 4 homolog [Trichonephila inaurata madagascariensis]
MNQSIHRVSLFEPKPQGIRCISYDEFSSRLAVSRSDSSIEIWDVKQNPYLEKVIPKISTSSVETLTWCNGRLFSAGLYGFITEHDLKTLHPKDQVNFFSGSPIWCMKFDYEKKYLAVGTEDGYVGLLLLSAEGLDYEKKLAKQEDSTLCLDWHKDGQIIVAGSINAIRIWSVDTGLVINRILLSKESKKIPTVVWSIAVTSDMTIISGDSTCIKTVYARSHDCLGYWLIGEQPYNQGGVTGQRKLGAGLSQRREYFLLASSSPVVGGQVQSVYLCRENDKHKKDLLSVAVNKEENVIYTSGVDCTVLKYMKCNSSGNWIRSYKNSVHSHDVRAIHIVGDFLVSGGDDCSLVFTKYPPKTAIKCFQFCEKSYCTVAATFPCMLLLYPKYVEVWSMITSDNQEKPKNLLRLKPTEDERIISGTISANATWLAYSSLYEIRLFCLKLDKNLKEAPSFHKVLMPDNIPSSSRILLFASKSAKLIFYDKSIYIIKCDYMEALLENTIDTEMDDEIQLMEISNDDTYLACSYHSGNITIYNLDTLKVHCKLPKYKCQATAMKFDPCSENLVVAYSDRKVVEYSLQKKTYSRWSKQDMLTRLQKDSYHPIISICFCKDKLYLQDENAIYVFERSEENELQPGKKKIKQSEDSAVLTNVDDDDDGYKTITKYEHLSSLHTFMDNLILIQIPSDRILEYLPPPLMKKVYGT